MTEDNSVEELRFLRKRVAHLEAEKQKHQQDEAIGTIAGILMVILLVLFGGTIWGIDKLLNGFLSTFTQEYLLESFLGGLIVTGVGGVVFIVIMFISLAVVDAVMRPHKEISIDSSQ